MKKAELVIYQTTENGLKVKKVCVIKISLDYSFIDRYHRRMIEGYVKFLESYFEVFSHPLSDHQKLSLHTKLLNFYRLSKPGDSRKARPFPSYSNCMKINWRIESARDNPEYQEGSDSSDESFDLEIDIKQSQRNLSKKSSLFVSFNSDHHYDSVAKYLQYQYLKINPEPSYDTDNTVSSPLFTIKEFSRESNVTSAYLIDKLKAKRVLEINSEIEVYRISYNFKNVQRISRRRASLLMAESEL